MGDAPVKVDSLHDRYAIEHPHGNWAGDSQQRVSESPTGSEDAESVRRIPSCEELYGESFRAYATENAPDCPECGAHALVAERTPETRRDFSERRTGDFVTWAVEVYRCAGCGKRIYSRTELDRETRVEREQENDKAVKRARMRREAPLLVALFRPKSWEAEVQRRYPHREEPDLMKRWLERRSATTRSLPQRATPESGSDGSSGGVS